MNNSCPQWDANRLLDWRSNQLRHGTILIAVERIFYVRQTYVALLLCKMETKKQYVNPQEKREEMWPVHDTHP